jgi:hypothetical protein
MIMMNSSVLHRYWLYAARELPLSYGGCQGIDDVSFHSIMKRNEIQVKLIIHIEANVAFMVYKKERRNDGQ